MTDRHGWFRPGWRARRSAPRRVLSPRAGWAYTAISGCDPEILIEQQAAALQFVRPEIARYLREECERLPAGDYICKARGVVLACRHLARNSARADERPNVLQQRQLRAADAHYGPAAFAAMGSCKCNGSLAVYDPGYIRGLRVSQLSNGRHDRVPVADPGLAGTEDRPAQERKTGCITR